MRDEEEYDKERIKGVPGKCLQEQRCDGRWKRKKKKQCSWNKEQHSMAADERSRAGGKT